MDIKNPTPLHLAYVATLPCETVMSAKQALDDKLQGSVAAYLTCGGVVNNQIKLQVVSTKLSSSFSSVLARRANFVRQPFFCL